MLLQEKKKSYLCKSIGALAQLAERLNGIQKVRSSILLCSTKASFVQKLVDNLENSCIFAAR